jgi:NADH-quinone oxidoreductase subunit C
MESLEEIKRRAEAGVPGARLQVVPNDAPANQPSLLVDVAHAAAVARFLLADPALRLDFASNVTGVDWPERVEKIKTKVKKLVDGVEKEVDETAERKTPAFLEVVYHLYSMEKRHGPVVLRQRTGDRGQDTTVASLTPIWRSCEFQERVHFDGHPDQRRILMWDGFKDYPMRKDYVEPDDYEYEPTAHDDVREKAKRHQEK